MMLHTAATDHGQLKQAGDCLGLETLLAAVQILDHAVARMRQSTQVRTLVEVALVRICRLEDLDELSQVIALVRDGGSLPSSPSRPPAAGRTPAAGTQQQPPVKKKPVTPVGSGVEQGEVSSDEGSALPESAQAGSTPPSSGAPEAAPQKVHKSFPSKDLPALTEDYVKRHWRGALAEVGGITEEFGADYESIAISAPNLLVVKLRVAYNKEWCERPDIKRKLEDSFSRLTGREMRVDFAHVPEAEVRKPEKRNLAQERAMKRREVEQHPLVQETMRLFEAEIVTVGEARRG
jgi:DNA polymerase-3 subunit gamma/tau